MWALSGIRSHIAVLLDLSAWPLISSIKGPTTNSSIGKDSHATKPRSMYCDSAVDESPPRVSE